MTSQKPLLQADGISKIYSQGALAVGLHRFSASFYRGEFVAITGSSGSGKSTLLNILSGLDSYNEGELFFKGEPTSHFNEEDRAAYRKDHVAFIFQDYNILDSYTVYQNIELALIYSMPDPVARKEKIMQLINAVGLSGREKQRCSKLSGGQKQRVSIARALAKDAPILFADEPCGNLDSAMTEEIMQLLHELSSEKLVFIVTHSYDEVAPYATRKIRLADGELVEDQIFKEVALPTEDVVPPVITKKQEFKGLLRVAMNNIIATPKRSFFGVFGLTMMTTIFIIGILLSITMIILSDFNNDYYRYDLQVMHADQSAIDDYQIREIESLIGVEKVYRNSVLLGGMCVYPINDEKSYYMMRPACNLNAKDLYEGTLPTQNDEIVISLPKSRKILKEKYVGKTMLIEFDQIISEKGLKSMQMKVVGIVFSNEDCVYLSNDFFDNQAMRTDDSDKFIVVTTKNATDLNKARDALVAKGYTVFHLYGDNAAQSIMAIIKFMIVLALIALMILIFRIIMGSYRALESSKRRDYNIMRTVGLPNIFVKSIYYVEMIIQGVIGWAFGLVLSIIIGIIYGFAVTPKVSYGFQLVCQFGVHLVWVAFVALFADIFVTIGNALRFNRYFYRNTVKMSLKEGNKND